MIVPGGRWRYALAAHPLAANRHDLHMTCPDRWVTADEMCAHLLWIALLRSQYKGRVPLHHPTAVAKEWTGYLLPHPESAVP